MIRSSMAATANLTSKNPTTTIFIQPCFRHPFSKDQQFKPKNRLKIKKLFIID